jgi:glyceraldehyde 3-phosphate dehydrogenase
LFFHEREITNLKWINIDFVIESTGKYSTFTDINKHILAGAKKVILSAPYEVSDLSVSEQAEQIKTVVLGVNENILNGSEKIVSNASCTTNNAAPMIKVINELCGIEQSYITTVHTYTTDQR